MGACFLCRYNWRMTDLPSDFLENLQRAVSGEVRVDPVTRLLYSTDASIYQIEPLGVVFPRTLDDLNATVELADRYGIPVLPRGSGSSLAGQAVGPALILDTSRYLDHILRIDPEARIAIVEPGVILTTLNRAAARYGLQFGPDPASADRATIGGVIGNNATGAHSIRYGMTADHLLSAEVVLADGSTAIFAPRSPEEASRQPGLAGEISRAAMEIRSRYAEAIRARWPRTWRNTAGYRLNYLLPWSATRPPQWDGATYPASDGGQLNPAPLLAGSEGTLAIVRTATLRLVPRPAHTVLAVLAYESIVAACEAVPELLRRDPSAVELVPRQLIRLARGVPAYARGFAFVTGDPAALLLVEFAGENLSDLEGRARALGSVLRVAISKEEQAQIWNTRKVGLGILMSQADDARPVAFIEDCAVPVERLGEFARGMKRILNEYGTQAAFYAHASAGCLHIRPALNLKTGEGRRNLRAIAEATLELVLRLGGTMTGEHGDGLARSEWLKDVYGEEILAAFRTLKRAADPKGILNPGKIVDAPPMDAHLRCNASYHPRPWLPTLDFSSQGGLVGAIEQCNGAGVCRKRDVGVMCPSFQATREEEHSTRGRANLLRVLLATGTSDRFLETAVYQALDLCLACKGCKAECPSGVDMAKLKIEFLHRYYRSHRRPWRDYLFGYLDLWAPLLASLGPLANGLLSRPAFKAVMERLLGISARRTFPAFRKPRRPNFVAGQDADSTTRRICLYLPDAFTRYVEPDVERAAMTVLRAVGVTPVPLPVLGAGRTLLSKGFLEAARRRAQRVLEAVRVTDPTGQVPVVGVEPSEVYVLRDEIRALLPEHLGEVEKLSARTWTLEEYLLRLPGVMDGALRVANSTPPILLHGHCHQKTQPPAPDGLPIGQEASAALLRVLGFDVDVAPTGCCGMAGAFGYESEHYDLSMQIGELALFPLVRESVSEGRLLVAPGASCRSHIADGTGASALHPAQLISNFTLIYSNGNLTNQ